MTNEAGPVFRWKVSFPVRSSRDYARVLVDGVPVPTTSGEHMNHQPIIQAVVPVQTGSVRIARSAVDNRMPWPVIRKNEVLSLRGPSHQAIFRNAAFGHRQMMVQERLVLYNRGRPHSALGPGFPDLSQTDLPDSGQRHKPPAGHRIVTTSVLGGLHHE